MYITLHTLQYLLHHYLAIIATVAPKTIYSLIKKVVVKSFANVFLNSLIKCFEFLLENHVKSSAGMSIDTPDHDENRKGK